MLVVQRFLALFHCLVAVLILAAPSLGENGEVKLDIIYPPSSFSHPLGRFTPFLLESDMLSFHTAARRVIAVKATTTKQQGHEEEKSSIYPPSFSSSSSSSSSSFSEPASPDAMNEASGTRSTRKLMWRICKDAPLTSSLHNFGQDSNTNLQLLNETSIRELNFRRSNRAQLLYEGGLRLSVGVDPNTTLTPRTDPTSAIQSSILDQLSFSIACVSSYLQDEGLSPLSASNSSQVSPADVLVLKFDRNPRFSISLQQEEDTVGGGKTDQQVDPNKAYFLPVNVTLLAASSSVEVVEDHIHSSSASSTTQSTSVAGTFQEEEQLVPLSSVSLPLVDDILGGAPDGNPYFFPASWAKNNNEEGWNLQEISSQLSTASTLGLFSSMASSLGGGLAMGLPPLRLALTIDVLLSECTASLLDQPAASASPSSYYPSLGGPLSSAGPWMSSSWLPEMVVNVCDAFSSGAAASFLVTSGEENPRSDHSFLFRNPISDNIEGWHSPLGGFFFFSFVVLALLLLCSILHLFLVGMVSKVFGGDEEDQRLESESEEEEMRQQDWRTRMTRRQRLLRGREVEPSEGTSQESVTVKEKGRPGNRTARPKQGSLSRGYFPGAQLAMLTLSSTFLAAVVTALLRMETLKNQSSTFQSAIAGVPSSWYYLFSIISAGTLLLITLLSSILLLTVFWSKFEYRTWSVEWLLTTNTGGSNVQTDDRELSGGESSSSSTSSREDTTHTKKTKRNNAAKALWIFFVGEGEFVDASARRGNAESNRKAKRRRSSKRRSKFDRLFEERSFEDGREWTGSYGLLFSSYRPTFNTIPCTKVLTPLFALWDQVILSCGLGILLGFIPLTPLACRGVRAGWCVGLVLQFSLLAGLAPFVRMRSRYHMISSLFVRGLGAIAAILITTYRAINPEHDDNTSISSSSPLSANSLAAFPKHPPLYLIAGLWLLKISLYACFFKAIVDLLVFVLGIFFYNPEKSMVRSRTNQGSFGQGGEKTSPSPVYDDESEMISKPLLVIKDPPTVSDFDGVDFRKLRQEVQPGGSSALAEGQLSSAQSEDTRGGETRPIPQGEIRHTRLGDHKDRFRQKSRLLSPWKAHLLLEDGGSSSSQGEVASINQAKLQNPLRANSARRITREEFKKRIEAGKREQLLELHASNEQVASQPGGRTDEQDLGGTIPLTSTTKTISPTLTRNEPEGVVNHWLGEEVLDQRDLYKMERAGGKRRHPDVVLTDDPPFPHAARDVSRSREEIESSWKRVTSVSPQRSQEKNSPSPLRPEEMVPAADAVAHPTRFLNGFSISPLVAQGRVMGKKNNRGKVVTTRRAKSRSSVFNESESSSLTSSDSEEKIGYFLHGVDPQRDQFRSELKKRNDRQSRHHRAEKSLVSAPAPTVARLMRKNPVIL